MTSPRPGGDAAASLYKVSGSVQQSSSLDPLRQSSPTPNQTSMVKITFQPVSAQKPEKDADGEQIRIPQASVSLSALFLSLSCIFSFFCRFLSTRYAVI